MAVNIPGVVAVAVFYIAILVVGIIAGRKTSKSTTDESVLVADRSLGFFVSIFTLTSTIVGGGYINGTAEIVASRGLLHAQAPIGYCVSLLLLAAFYAPKMREANYVTMFDPFQLKYGRKVGAILCIPQFLGDLFWTAAVLAALGSTISIILDMDSTLAIIISSAVAIIYTFFGGLYAVAYTDVIQFFFIVVGLVMASPFALKSPAVDLSRISDSWLGEIPVNTIGSYFDTYMICICGGIPWQAIFQRILACKSKRVAQISTLIATFLCFMMAGPPIALGLAGSAADWNQTSWDGPIPLPAEKQTFILPLVLNYITSQVVGIIGIGAISAAVMSSADSTILSTSSVFTKNIYNDIFRRKATEKELIWVLRINVIVVGTLSSLVAILSNTIYGLYVLCSDLMYVCLFPQLTLVLWMPSSNAYGSIAGFFVSLILRLIGGEKVLGLPPLLRYPFFDEANSTQLFPVRTFAMLLGGVVIVVVSWLTNALFLRGLIPRSYDVLKCYRQRTAEIRKKEMKDMEEIYDKEVSALTGEIICLEDAKIS